jgi:hypothetical protein
MNEKTMGIVKEGKTLNKKSQFFTQLACLLLTLGYVDAGGSNPLASRIGGRSEKKPGG